MKKFSLIVVLISVFFLSGCLKGGTGEQMDRLNSEGFYHYINRDLDFGLYLPSSFEYYHVQRKNLENYTDIEFFTPTADTSYYQEIQSYAKPIVVRIWDKKYWDGLEEDEDKAVFEEKTEKRGKVYTIKFWENIPKDWELKWSEETRREILDRFEIY